MDQNLELDERKLNTIKLRILQMETDNEVKKESNSAMEDKIKKRYLTLKKNMAFQVITSTQRC